MALTPGPGRHLINLLKTPDKAGNIVVSDIQSNLINGQRCGREQEQGFIHPQPGEGVVDILSSVFLVKGGQIRYGHVEMVRQHFLREIGIKSFVLDKSLNILNQNLIIFIVG